MQAVEKWEDGTPVTIETYWRIAGIPPSGPKLRGFLVPYGELAYTEMEALAVVAKAQAAGWTKVKASRFQEWL